MTPIHSPVLTAAITITKKSCCYVTDVMSHHIPTVWVWTRCLLAHGTVMRVKLSGPLALCLTLQADLLAVAAQNAGLVHNSGCFEVTTKPILCSGQPCGSLSTIG